MPREDFRDPSSVQGPLFEHFLGLLKRLSADQPLVLAIEDLHWADLSTLDLLRFVLRKLHRARVLLIATYRTDEVRRTHPLLPFLAEAERMDRTERLDLNRFEKTEVAELLTGILDSAPEPAVTDRVHDRSGGNAFFIEELVAVGLHRRDLAPALRDVLMARLANLDPNTQRLLHSAAVVGRHVSADLLDAVAGLGRAAAARALRNAVDQYILASHDDWPEPTYAFRHALMQEAIYHDLLPTERTDMHRKVAVALSALSGARSDPQLAAERSHHWFAAHDLPEALAAAIDAASSAERAFAFAEALAQYERALAIWSQVPDAHERVGFDRLQAIERAARVAIAAAPDRATALLQEALSLVDAGFDPARAGVLYERLGRSSWLSGIPGAEDAYAEALRLVPPQPPTAARARVLAGAAQLAMGGHDTEAVALAREAIDISRAVGVLETEAHALVTLGSSLSALGQFDEALASLEQARELASRIGATEELIRAYKYIGVAQLWFGRYGMAVDAERKAFELARQSGLVGWHGLDALYMVFLAQLASGRWRDAAETVASIEDNSSPTTHLLSARIMAAAPAQLAIARGRPAEARQHVAALEALLHDDPDLDISLEVHDVRADLAALEGRWLDARDDLRKKLDLMQRSDQPASYFAHDYARAIRVEVEIISANRSRTAPETDLIDGYLGQLATLRTATSRERPAYLPQVDAWVALGRTEAARAKGHIAPDDWRALARRWADLGRPYEQAYARYREAEVLLASHAGRVTVREPLTAAYDTATDLGAEGLMADIQTLARRARIDLGSPEPDATDASPNAAARRFGLTGREAEVLRLVAAGRTNREIANELFITEKTAGAHVSKILAKLDVRRRTQVAAIAQREGLAGGP